MAAIDFDKEIAKSRFLFENELEQAGKLIASGHTAEALQLLSHIANFAWNNYTGYHASAKLEGYPGEISAKHLKKNNSPEQPVGTAVKRVLHVATHIYETGGHTPLMLKWIQRDSEREHHLFMTQQEASALPLKQFEKHGFRQEQVIFTKENNESYLQIAQLLYDKSADYDLVVLHIHPDDIIPNLAFAGHKHTPVYFLNHADHCFWLGASITDGLVQIRETNIPVDAKRRGIPAEKQFYLPIPVEAVAEVQVNVQEIRNQRGLDSYETILLTTGSENKFVFFNEYNYFKAITPVLEKNPQAVLLVVGVRPESKMAQQYAHPQIRFMGLIMPAELAELEVIADIYVENLPYSSFTALLQVFMRKKAIHFVYSPLNITQLFNDNSLYTKTKEEWQQRLDKLINDSTYRQELATETYNNNYKDYTLAFWKQKLEAIYSSALSLKPGYNALPQQPIDNISDNEMLLYKLLQERYRYRFFKQKPAIFIGRLFNFMYLKSKGYKIKKIY